MAVGIVDRQKLVNIADAVRAKKGITGEMTLDAIASNITSIPTADNNAKFDFAGSGSRSSGRPLYYLTKIDLSGWDTSNVTDMNSTFYNCSSLTSLDVSNFNTSKVTSMGNMFKGCSSLTSLDLSNFDTSNVTSIEYMFQNCSSLETLDISNFDFSNVKGGAYTGLTYFLSDCSKLSTLTLPQTVTFKNSGITLKYMFDNCSSLTTLDLSGWDTSNVKYMESMFKNCSSLTTLDLSNWNTSTVTNMSFMFDYCYKLSNLTLGTDWASNSSISSFDLSYCPLTRESAVDVINKLATRNNSPVIEFNSKVTLYQSEIDIATNKGWSVSGCTVLVDAETATVGQYTIIDGVISKCVYVADTPQGWGQRVFIAVSSFTDSNGNSTFEWGGYGTATGITAQDIGTGLSNTNSLIAMNLQSSDGTPTIWDAITEFRNTHSDSWFVPSANELTSNSINAWSSSEDSDRLSCFKDNIGNKLFNPKNYKYGLNPAIYV